MDRDEVMRVLSADGGVPGPSCRAPGFATAAGVRFRECCGSDAADYGCREFVGRTPGGGLICLGLNRDTGMIYCGPHGYHYVHGRDACV